MSGAAGTKPGDAVRKALRVSELERCAALKALQLAADRLYEAGAPQAYVDDARAVLSGLTPEGEFLVDSLSDRQNATPEQVAKLFEELAQGPVQGGRNAQIAYARCAKIVRSKLARADLPSLLLFLSFPATIAAVLNGLHSLGAFA